MLEKVIGSSREVTTCAAVKAFDIETERDRLRHYLCGGGFGISKGGEQRTCKTTFGGQVVCGDQIIGITLEQYEAGLKKRAEEIRSEEAEKRIQLQKLLELTERATSAEKESLRSQIAAVEAEKRALEAESKGVSDRQANLQVSYDGRLLGAGHYQGREGAVKFGRVDTHPPLASRFVRFFLPA